jgi:hypothetical protein
VADLGVIKLGNYSATNSTWTGVTGTQPVLDDITTPVDSTYLHDDDVGSNSGLVAWFPLDNMPADFESMDTLSIQIRYHRPAYDAVKTVVAINARIFIGDGSATSITSSEVVASSVTNTAATNSSVIDFTTVNTASTKTTWDGAWLRFELIQSKTKGGSADEMRITAAQLTGTYTAAGTTHQGIATPETTVTVTADGSITKGATGDVSAAVTAAADGGVIRAATAGVTAGVTATADGSLTKTAVADASVTASVTADGSITKGAVADVSTAVDVYGDGTVATAAVTGVASFTAAVTATASGTRTLGALADVSASATIVADGFVGTKVYGAVPSGVGGDPIFDSGTDWEYYSTGDDIDVHPDWSYGETHASALMEKRSGGTMRIYAPTSGGSYAGGYATLDIGVDEFLDFTVHVAGGLNVWSTPYGVLHYGLRMDNWANALNIHDGFKVDAAPNISGGVHDLVTGNAGVNGTLVWNDFVSTNAGHHLAYFLRVRMKKNGDDWDFSAKLWDDDLTEPGTWDTTHVVTDAETGVNDAHSPGYFGIAFDLRASVSGPAYIDFGSLKVYDADPDGGQPISVTLDATGTLYKGATADITTDVDVYGQTAGVVRNGDATVTTAATLTADGTVNPPTLSVDIAADGTIVSGVFGDATITTAATLAATGSLTKPAVADTSASVSLAATGTIYKGATADLSTAVDVTADGTLTKGAVADLSAAVDVTADGSPTKSATADATTSATLSASGTLTYGAVADATLDVDIDRAVGSTGGVIIGVGSFTVAVDATGSGTMSYAADADVSTAVDVASTGRVVRAATATSTTDVALTADGTRTGGAVADVTVTVSISAAATMAYAAVADLSTTVTIDRAVGSTGGDISGVGHFEVDIALDGSATATYAAAADTTVDVDLTATGSRTLTGLADVLTDVTVAATGGKILSGVADLTVAVDIQATGTAARSASADVSVDVEIDRAVATTGGEITGIADVSVAVDVTAAATLNYSAVADVSVAVNADGSGSIGRAGVADTSLAVNVDATGERTKGAIADVSVDVDITAAGSTVYGAVADATVDVTFDRAVGSTGGQVLAVAGLVVAVDVEGLAAPITRSGVAQTWVNATRSYAYYEHFTNNAASDGSVIEVGPVTSDRGSVPTRFELQEWGEYRYHWIAVSPDRSKVLYGRDPKGASGNTPNEIWVSGPTGQSPTRIMSLTSGDKQNDENTYIEWGHHEWLDNNTLVFSGHAAADTTYSIWKCAADGTGHVQLTDGTTLSIDPSVTPDGRILYINGAVLIGTQEIWIMDDDGLNKTRLSTDSYADWDPYASPDNTRIINLHIPTGGVFDNALRDIDGSNYEVVLDGSADVTSYGFPRWLDNQWVIASRLGASGEELIAYRPDDASGTLTALVSSDATNRYREPQPVLVAPLPSGSLVRGAAAVVTLDVDAYGDGTVTRTVVDGEAHPTVSVSMQAAGGVIRSGAADATVDVTIDRAVGTTGGEILGVGAVLVDVELGAAGTNTFAGQADTTVDVDVQADGSRIVRGVADMSLAVDLTADAATGGVVSGEAVVSVAVDLDATGHRRLLGGGHCTVHVNAQATGGRRRTAVAAATTTITLEATGTGGSAPQVMRPRSVELRTRWNTDLRPRWRADLE